MTRLVRLLLAEDAQQHRRAVRRTARRAVLHGKKVDGDRIFDRVKRSEGRLTGEKRHYFDLAPRWGGVTLSPHQQERLEGVVCRICQRFVSDCALLTQHQATIVRIVAIHSAVEALEERAA